MYCMIGLMHFITGSDLLFVWFPKEMFVSNLYNGQTQIKLNR